jgi:hypothetical protein
MMQIWIITYKINIALSALLKKVMMKFYRYMFSFTVFLTIAVTLTALSSIETRNLNRRSLAKTNGIQETISKSAASESISDVHSRSLLYRNMIRMQQLRERYEGVLDLNNFHQPISNQTMIYSCHSRCNGWGDRVRGIVSAYVLALLMRRRFMIDITVPCRLTQALLPNIVDWRFKKSLKINRNKRKQLELQLMYQDVNSELEMLKKIESEDFITIWKPYDDILITTDAYFITPALSNPYTNSSWLIGRLPLREATQELFFPLLFELLFKPNHAIVKAVNAIIQLPYRKLVCVHIRQGRNPTNPLDNIFPTRTNMTSTMIDFIRNHIRIAKQKHTRIFVTSDSDQAIADVSEHFPNLTVTVPGKIMHIHYIGRSKNQTLSTKEICDGFMKTLVEFFVLGECDVSILSHSGFSSWATRRRIDADGTVFVYQDHTRHISQMNISYRGTKPFLNRTKG